MKRIIMLSGYSGSGKSYIADIFKEKGWFTIALADKLKDEVSVEYGIDRNDLETQEGKKKIYHTGDTYRELLINASKKKKKKDMNYYCKKVIETIRDKALDRDVLISDMRFPHEYYYIKIKMTDYLVSCARVYRDTYNKIDDFSERALEGFPFDISIQNDDTLAEQLKVNFL